MSESKIAIRPTIRQIMAYEELREELEKNHKGQRALLANECLVGIYDTYEAAMVAATENGFAFEDYIVPWIGVEAFILSLGA